MIRFLPQFYLVGGLLTALVFSNSAAAKIAGLSGTITKFHLNSCLKDDCIKLDTNLAYVGLIDGSYASDNASFTITSTKKFLSSQTYHSHDLFYDCMSQKIFLHQIDERPGQEAYYDLQTGQLRFFAINN